MRTLPARGARLGALGVVGAGSANADACKASPARVGVAITVGATNASDAGCTSSDWGPCLDLYAPGENVAVATSPWRGRAATPR